MGHSDVNLTVKRYGRFGAEAEEQFTCKRTAEGALRPAGQAGVIGDRATLGSRGESSAERADARAILGARTGPAGEVGAPGSGGDDEFGVVGAARDRAERADAVRVGPLGYAAPGEAA